MGIFRFTCVCLLGAFAFAALYHVVLWLRDRRSMLSLASALHAASSGLLTWSILRLVQADTIDTMQAAVDFRATTAIPVLLSLTFLLAVFAGLRPHRLVAAATVGVAVTIAARIAAGTLGNDVLGLERVVVWGEPLWTPLRAPGIAHWMAAVLVGAASCFAVACGWRMWADDRVSSLLVMGTGVTSLLGMPAVTVLHSWTIVLQPLTVLPQALFILVAVMATAREHEARARAADAAQRLYRAMFDQTYQYVGLLDLEGRLLEANRTSLEQVGAPIEALRGLRFADTPWWTGSPDLAHLEQAVADAAAGRTCRREMTLVDRQGRPRLLDFSIRPLRDDGGRVIGLIPEARDITDERAAQRAHAQIEAQLHQAQKLEAVGQLAGGIAHDFNNLLTVIHGFTSLLLAAPDVAGRREELGQIASASERAMTLTRQLLTFSSHAVPDEQVVRPDDLVRHALPLLGRLVGADIVLDVALSPDTPPVRTDPAQLERVLINLVVNARDAMPSGGRLGIATRPYVAALDAGVGLEAAARWTVLVVRDTGVGMSAEVQARLFEPFFTTKPPGKGTGLGLAVVDRVVKQSHGHVRVTSAEGEGTTFAIYLPACAEAPSASTSASVAVVEAPRASATILVVEDEPAVRLLTVAVLAEQAYVVLEAGTPDEAVRVAEAHDGVIDLLLSDVVMPGGSATTIVDALQPRFPRMQVLFMSGYAADEAVRRGVAAGAHNFLQKPFTPAVLATRVRDLLAGRAGPEPEAGAS